MGSFPLRPDHSAGHSNAIGAPRAVLLYAAVGNEVATNLIFDDARSAGRPVYFPVADPAAHSLDFRAVRSSDDLRPGHFGIPEPSDGERFEPGSAATRRWSLCPVSPLA